MKEKRDVGESCCSRGRFLHPASMSDKTKVYQGVRVKTTVKELLQRHRAREADDKNLAVSRSAMDIPSLCVGLSTIQDQYVDAAVMQADAEYSVQLQGNTVFYQHPQYGSETLPATGGFCPDMSIHGSALHPAASTFPPLPGAQGQLSPEAEYYHGMASSSPESVQFSSPVDPDSYSPQHSSYSSSSSSSCYDSPTRVDPGFSGFPSMDRCHYQPCTITDCCCQLRPNGWPAQQEGFYAAAEYASYCGPTTTTTTDYSCAFPAEDYYFKKDLPFMSSDMYYNIF